MDQRRSEQLGNVIDPVMGVGVDEGIGDDAPDAFLIFDRLIAGKLRDLYR